MLQYAYYYSDNSCDVFLLGAGKYFVLIYYSFPYPHSFISRYKEGGEGILTSPALYNWWELTVN